MLKIATPVSHLFELKKQGNKISNFSDCLEVREKTYKLSYPNEKLFHCDKSLTHIWDGNFKREFTEIISKKKKLKLISFQCTCICENEVLKDGMFILSGRKFSYNEMLDNSKKNLEWIYKNFKDDFDIALENNNYFNSGAYEIITDGNFISDVIKKNNIFFLLDIAHAIITAFNKNINLEDYLNSLPLENIKQIHICSPVIDINKKIALDAHNPPDQKVFDLLKKILTKNKNIEYLTIEYYKDVDILIDSLKKLKHLISNEI